MASLKAGLSRAVSATNSAAVRRAAEPNMLPNTTPPAAHNQLTSHHHQYIGPPTKSTTAASVQKRLAARFAHGIAGCPRLQMCRARDRSTRIASPPCVARGFQCKHQRSREILHYDAPKYTVAEYSLASMSDKDVWRWPRPGTRPNRSGRLPDIALTRWGGSKPTRPGTGPDECGDGAAGRR